MKITNIFFSAHILDIKSKLLKKIKIENESKLIGNNFSKLVFGYFSKSENFTLTNHCQLVYFHF